MKQTGNYPPPLRTNPVPVKDVMAGRQPVTIQPKPLPLTLRPGRLGMGTRMG